MATTVLTNLSSGAPTLVGVNGSLCTVLDWALPQAGWAIEYTSGNARVYRPGSGNRHRLHVNHDSAVSGSVGLATIRGCEGASAAATLVDPFPTVAQVTNANSTVCMGTNTGTAREYVIIVSPTYVLMAMSSLMANTSGWDIFFFGDLAPAYSGDNYATAILVGASSTATATTARAMAGSITAAPIDSGKLFWVRSVDGSIKSTRGCLSGSVSSASPTSFCTLPGTPLMRAGYLNQIMREKMAANCIGSSTSTASALALVRRAWIPNLWNPLHTGIGALSSDDTFTDTAYAPGSLFRIVPASTTIAAIIEMSDTWSAPSG